MDKKQGKPCSYNICNEFKKDEEYMSLKDSHTKIAKPSLLMHSCCGPCSTAVIERLAPEYEITIFFYNPNITDEKEYEMRKAAQIEFIEKYNENPENPFRVGFKEGPYDKRNYFALCKGLENEPEGGKRCQECFVMRLKKTAETASLLGYDSFGTTLTISPHKDYDTVSRIGKRMSAVYGVGFLDKDFKKKGGFQRSIELSKKYNLYRQNYCGCKFANHNISLNTKEEE